MAKQKPLKYKERNNLVRLEKKKEKLSETVQKQWVAKAFEWMREGYSTSHIKELIKKDKKGSISDEAIQVIIHQAYRLISESQFIRQEEIRVIHLERYNANIKRLLEVKDPDDEGDGEDEDDDEGGGMDSRTYQRLRDAKIKACFDCLDTLKQKEELLQFHNKDFIIEVDIEHTVTVEDQPKQVKRDVTKLTFDEQMKLLDLMKVAKMDEHELVGVIYLNQEQKVETIDVEAEVIEDKPNVALIKQVDPEKIPEPIRKPAHIPALRLQEALNRMAAQKFKEVGTLTDEEKQLFE